MRTRHALGLLALGYVDVIQRCRMPLAHMIRLIFAYNDQLHLDDAHTPWLMYACLGIGRRRFPYTHMLSPMRGDHDQCLLLLLMRASHY